MTSQRIITPISITNQAKGKDFRSSYGHHHPSIMLGAQEAPMLAATLSTPTSTSTHRATHMNGPNQATLIAQIGDSQARHRRTALRGPVQHYM
jgi:hypothetical protein